MKTNEFIATLRKGNNVGTLEITIPPKFHRLNGLVIGQDYIFSIKDLEVLENVPEMLSTGRGKRNIKAAVSEAAPDL
jgi:acyl carrier protein phosphodiesterase